MMNQSHAHFASDLKLAEELGEFFEKSLGPEIIAHRQSVDFWIKTKPDNTKVTSGDYLADKRKKAWINARCPNDIIVSEEDANPVHNMPRSAWVLDPIDGTNLYIAGGDFALQAAKLVDGEVRIGIVYFPKTRDLLFGVKGEGAYLRVDGGAPQRLQVSSPTIIDPSKLAVTSDLMTKFPGSKPKEFRSSWIALLKGELDARVATGFGFAWDLLPYLGIIEAAGGYGRTKGHESIDFPTTEVKHRAIWAANKFVADEIAAQL